MLLISLGLHAAMAVLFAAHLAPRPMAKPVYYIDLLPTPTPAPRLEMPLPERPVEKKVDVAVAPPRPPVAEPRRETVEPVRPQPPPAPRSEPPPPRREPVRPLPSPRAEAAVRLQRPMTADLGPTPDLRSRGARPREERLPQSTAVALAATGGLDPVAITVAVGDKYAERRGRSDPGAPVRGDTVAKTLVDLDPGPGPKLNRGRAQERSPTAMEPPPRAAAFTASAEPEAAVPGPAAAPGKEAPPPAERLAEAAASFDYLDRVAPADLDRMRLVTLNRLRTCLDPEGEMRLRTRLATILGQSATCRTGGVVFDIRQPESAWSIHLDIYNYEGREFQDRCAALRLAVDCCERKRR